MSPRPAPLGTVHAGRMLVWAIDAVHLPNYLLPRECPRVCWATASGATGLLGSPSGRVIVVEQAWLKGLRKAGLTMHQVEPDGFSCVDASAGYWVSDGEAQVRRVQMIDDCVAALAEREVELRVVPSLAPYVDAVEHGGVEFSVIRMRNAGRAVPDRSRDGDEVDRSVRDPWAWSP